jgi:hypothetical protein
MTSSKDSIEGVDSIRASLLQGEATLHADVWWQEQVVAFLDQLPSLWNSFPEMFAGGRVPFLAEVIDKTEGLPRAIRLALDNQYRKDSLVRFKQIELEKNLSRLFVDLDVDIRYVSEDVPQTLFMDSRSSRKMPFGQAIPIKTEYVHRGTNLTSALRVLMDEDSTASSRILLEGGPGQGKSTITQMMVQIYRNELLKKQDLEPEGRWTSPEKIRLPFRIELRNYAEWLGGNPEGSVEEFIALILKRDSGGSEVKVEDIHSMVERSPILIIFDGLDEVGSDELRDISLTRISECIDRFALNLKSDVKAIVTTRPPAIAGRREHLINFSRFPIAPMEPQRVKNYIDRWLAAQLQGEEDRQIVKESFERRQNEPHVKALAKNPMQLSVLLHFIWLKGEAFPDRRAELYREYFRTVIDRDVEKSQALRKQRYIIEVLHQLLGYKIHSLTEANKADGTLTRGQLLSMVQEWLNCQGHSTSTAHEIFKLGEERLGLIVALRGEGEKTRYGYEIQPIREYFAAAFINEQIEGNAHDVYQALLHRQYWKEVALFLAGLRRPNEKADLVTRAKDIDNDEKIGWRQDGRATTLQLLQEGVLSQPHHVYADALDFIIDLLDPSINKVFNEPKDFIDSLIAVLKQGDSSRQLQRMLTILKANDTNLDAQVLYRLYKPLHYLLEAPQVRKELLAYEGDSSSLRSKVRIIWPYTWGVNMQPVANVKSFWQGILDEDLTLALWQTALEQPLVTNLPIKDSLHAKLIELFATDPSPSYGIFDPYSLNNLFERINTTKSSLAVWKLVEYHQLLNRIPFEPHLTTNNLKDSSVDCRGLNEATSSLVTELINSLYELISSALLKKGDLQRALSNHIHNIKKNLDKPGLLGLIACRAAVSLINLEGIANLAMHRALGEPNKKFLQSYVKNPELRSMYSALRQFFKTNDFGSTMPYYLPYQYTKTQFMPTDIKITARGEFVSITSLLADSICKGKKLPFSWMKRMLMPRSITRPLVDKCEKHLHKLLPAFTKFHFKNTSDVGKPLRVQSMHKILKHVRTSDDPDMIKGALEVIFTSNFIKLAGKELILKMVRASEPDSEFAQSLFGVTQSTHKLDSKDLLLRLSLAEDITDSPNEYGLKYTTSAANFLAEHRPLALPPLVEEEDKLGLRIQQPTAKNTTGSVRRSPPP